MDRETFERNLAYWKQTGNPPQKSMAAMQEFARANGIELPQSQGITDPIEQKRMTHQEAEMPGRGGHFAQGLSMNWSDEIEAGWRSTFGDEDYDAALAEVHKRLDAYMEAHPQEAAKMKAAGVLSTLPPQLAIAYLSGGTSAPGFVKSFLTAIGLGATIGVTEKAGEIRGDLFTGENMVDMGESGLYGAAWGGATLAGLRGTGGLMRLLSNQMDARFGDAAAREAQRWLVEKARASGKSVDDVIRDVESGKIMADDQTLRESIRALRINGGDEVERLFRETYGGASTPGRPEALRSDVESYLKGVADETGSPSPLSAQVTSQAEQRAAASADYDAVFAGHGEVGPTTGKALADTLARDPALARDAARLYRLNTGKTPFFTVDDSGQVVFTRTPDLEEAETIRRALQGAKDQAMAPGGNPQIGGAYGDLETDLRSQLDTESAALQEVRRKWAAINSEDRAFELGKKAFARGGDQVQLDMLALQNKNNPALIAAYKRGLVTSARKKPLPSLTRNLASEESRESQVIGGALSDEQAAEIARRAGLANDAQAAKNAILGGSPTAATQQRSGGLGTGIDAARAVLGADLEAGARLVGQMLKSNRPELSQAAAVRATQTLLESNPVLVKQALADKDALQKLNSLVYNIARAGPRSDVLAGVQGPLAVQDGVLPMLSDPEQQ